MNIVSKHSISLILVSAILLSCASSAPVKKVDLFADAGRFESLASNAWESPSRTPVTVPEAVSVAVVGPPAGGLVKVLPAQVSAYVLDSGSLISLPENLSPEATRVVASVASVTATAATDILSADVALTTLVRGNERFVSGAVRGEHRDESRRRALSSTQNPHSIILSSSDSRVPPELIFDQGLGDLLTIRVGGNVLGSAQVASIEDAIQNLGAKLVVVMGHESSTLLKAAIDGGKGQSLDQDWLMTSVRSNLASRKIASATAGAALSDPKLRNAAVANVDAVTDQLLARSKIVNRAVAEGRVKVIRAVYGTESGKVDFWGMK